MLNLNMFSSLEKICAGVAVGAGLVSFIGGGKIAVLAVIVGAGSFLVRKYLLKKPATPPASN